MEGRRRITLYDQMTAGSNSTSLADLILNDNVVLTDQKSDDAAAAAAVAVSGGESCQLSQQSRTLIDILHEDEQHNNETTSDRKSKRALNFMDKLRLKLTLNSKSNYNSNNHNNNNGDNNYDLTQQGNTYDHHHHHQQQQQQNDVVSADPETAADVSAAEPVVAISLMDLLEETDVETVGSNRMSDADFEIVNNEFDEGEEGGGGASMVERNCCVCMVRHKGAAFIPCGHTFCRACSREVWVSRGNCPLCNNFILEILDIF